MVYQVIFSKEALKNLSKINEPYYTKIKEAIQNLAQNPKPQGSKKLKGRTAYRVRVGNYRIIYDVFDNELIVEIITLGHRKNIYE